MKTKIQIVLFVSLVLTVPVYGQDWTQFRGPDGISAADTRVPIEFDDSKNIAWKSELPGRGVSGPIIVGGKVFVTASGGPKQDRLHTVCID